MVTAKPSIDDILASANRQVLKARLEASGISPNLPQAQQISARALAIPGEKISCRLGIIHTYTSDLMEPWLAFEAAINGLDLSVYHAPYGVTFQEAEVGSGLAQHAPDITWLMLRREDLHPQLKASVAALSPDRQDALRQEVVQGVLALVGRFRRLPLGQIVLTILPAMSGPGLGQFDAQSDRSEAGWWAAVKRDIARAFREGLSSTLFFDLDETLMQIGRRRFFDMRYWYSCAFPFTAEAARELARKIIGMGVALKMPKAKVIVLDADNTLWGGVIGEDGMTGIALGPDYPGSCFVDFQRRLLDYQQRGFILALCSKNNAADLDQVLREHPHQVLRDSHFAARRVNWEPKAENLAALARELNLGLDSFVFVDDSSHECEAVRQALPQVEVIQVPARAVDVPNCLENVARLEVFSLTAEDLAKTAMYAQEKLRREMQEQSVAGEGGTAAYLRSLDMKMRISLNQEAHLTRLAQLTQKTNQFNLTTRRYDEHQMSQFMSSPEWMVADFSLADIFGDSGIVGLALFQLDQEGGRARLDTFLMSCRVIGREAESAFLQTLLGVLNKNGIRDVDAEYLPTAKNGLAKEFLPSQGFKVEADGMYRMSLLQQAERELAAPIAVSLDV